MHCPSGLGEACDGLLGMDDIEMASQGRNR